MALLETTTADWRALELEWIGGVVNSEPAGWKDPGFDDSAWSDVVAPPNPSLPSSYVRVPNATIITCDAAWTGLHNRGLVWLTRLEFEILADDLPDVDGILSWAADNFAQMWLNGTEIVGPLTDGESITTGVSTVVDKDLFVVGTNVLAVMVTNEDITVTSTWAGNPSMVELRLGIPEAWDVFAADDLMGAPIATLVNARERMIRIEEDGAGVGGFTINRHSDEATAAILAKGNLVRVRFPEISNDYLFAFFLERGDFEILSSDEEGGEELQFGGKGSLSYLNRARMDAVAYSTGLDTVDTWSEIWRTGKITNPVGACLLDNDPTYLYVISSTTRKIYKLRESDRVIVGSSPPLFTGGANACGLCADPTDNTIMWALQSEIAGGSGNTKIRKVDVTGAISGWNVATTFDLGSSVQLTDIEADSSNLWTTRFDGTTSLYKRSKSTGAVVTGYTISYGGVTQTQATGSSINGTEIALWYYGKKRALIADLSAPSTIIDKISTTGLSAFGGAWTTEGGNDYFYPVSSTSDLTWKYQITSATPHDPVDGIWRLDEGTPGAILARIVAEITHASRPQHPVPDLTTSFDFTTDTDSNTWDSHPGTAEFTANIGDLVDEVILRLVPFGLTVQMDPNTLELLAYNADDFGVDRHSATFASGKVRIEGGVNAAEALRARMDERRVDSHMLVLGEAGKYARAEDDDLGYVREGFISTNLSDSGALEGTGDAELARERRDSDSQVAVVPWGNAPLLGLYLPGPVGTAGHYWVGDTVTVASGSGEFDLNEVSRDVKAITISELEQGIWQVVVDLASIFKPIYDPVAPTSSPVGGTSIGGTTTTTSVAKPITVKDSKNGESYSGTIIESDDWGVFQAGTGRVGVSIRGRSIRDATDAELDAIADGQGIAWDALLEAWVPVDLTGGRPPYDYVVAAADSAPELQAIADAVCDGTNDEVEINAAIAAAASAGRTYSILLLPGTYVCGDSVDFTPWVALAAKWVVFEASGTEIIAGANMTTLIDLAPGAGGQIVTCADIRLGIVDGNDSGGGKSVTQLVNIARFSDNMLRIEDVRNGDGIGVHVQQSGVSDYPAGNNKIDIEILRNFGGTAFMVTGGTNAEGFQGNTVHIGEIIACSNAIVLGASANQNASYNTFICGVIEHNTNAGIYDYCGGNTFLVGNLNTHTTHLGGPSGMTLRSTYRVHIDWATSGVVDAAVLAQHWVQINGLGPGDELDYAEVTSTVNVTSTNEASPTNVVSGTSKAYDGGPVWVHFSATDGNTDAVAGRYLIVNLWDGSTDLGRIALVQNNGAGVAEVTPINGYRRLTPSAGTHQFHVKAWCSAGAGNVQAGAGGAGTRMPAFLRITKA